MPVGTAGDARLIEWQPVTMFKGAGSVSGTLQFGPVNAVFVQRHVNEWSSEISSTHTPPYKQPV